MGKGGDGEQTWELKEAEKVAERAMERRAQEAEFRRRIALPAGTVVVLSGMRAEGVPDAESKKGSGGSDPYIRFTLTLGPSEQELASLETRSLSNTNNPDWSGDPPLRLVLARPCRQGVPLTLTAVIFDKDFTNEDDRLARVAVTGLRGHPAGHRQELLFRACRGWSTSP